MTMTALFCFSIFASLAALCSKKSYSPQDWCPCVLSVCVCVSSALSKPPPGFLSPPPPPPFCPFLRPFFFLKRGLKKNERETVSNRRKAGIVRQTGSLLLYPQESQSSPVWKKRHSSPMGSSRPANRELPFPRKFVRASKTIIFNSMPCRVCRQIKEKKFNTLGKSKAKHVWI